jgi:photosystem II stability/assembly factor-like uncharacterized protein
MSNFFGIKKSFTRKFIFLIHIFIIFLFNHPAFAQTNFWEEASGYFTVGDVTHLAINSGGDIFAGTNWGIYRSTNEGNSWEHLTDGIVFSLNIAPNGDIYTYYCSSNNCNFFKSTDNGDSWNEVNTGINPNIILNAIAIRSNGTIFAGGKYNVIRSTDNGNTWTSSLVASDEEVVTAIGLASGLVFAGITDIALPSAYGTLRRSTDNGDTWSAFSPNWPNESINSIIRNNAGFTFAATSKGIRRSTDFGATWTLTSLQNVPVSALAINSIGYLFAAAGGSSNFVESGIYRSTNRGDSWVKLTSFIPLLNTLSVAVNPAGNIYAGTRSTGVFRSIDTALTWNNINQSLYSDQVKNLTFLQNGSLLAGTADGIFITSDNGEHWLSADNDFQINIVNAIWEDNNHIVFSGLDGIGVAKSTDGGFSWTLINSGISSQRVFSINGKPGGILLAGTQSGIFRSTDNGNLWSPGGSGPTNFIRSLVKTPTGEFFSGSGSGIHFSTDDGVSWNSRNNGLTNTIVGSLVRNGNGDLFAGTNGFVFRSTDNGLNWFEASNGLPNSFINSLCFGGNGSLYASTVDSGIFVTTDNGLSWTPQNSGLPPLNTFFGTSSLAYSNDGYLFTGINSAFTVRAGVFRSINPMTSVKSSEENFPNEFSLAQNFPNPFNPTTKIRYSIPDVGSGLAQTVLKVYDILGNEVATLVNEEKPAGVYEVDFNAAGLSSGMYFYRMQAGSPSTSSGQCFVETKKMILLH